MSVFLYFPCGSDGGLTAHEELGSKTWDLGPQGEEQSQMDKLFTQDIEIRSMTTLIDSRISCLASRSHGQGIVVKEDPVIKVSTNMVISSKEVIKSLKNVLKIRKGDFAFKATHAGKGIVDCKRGKSFSFHCKVKRA
jgi:hypothetical protein